MWHFKMLRKLREKDISKYHIQLCCALSGMLLVFVIGIDETENYEGCVTVSVLIHYFTLVAMMWMVAEALLMFQKLVLVFFQITTRYIAILSLICWGMLQMVYVLLLYIYIYETVSSRITLLASFSSFQIFFLFS